MIPHAHQVQTIANLNKDKQLIVLPSGSGKTNTVAFDVNEKRPKSFLYVVHRNDILTQTIDFFKKICGEWMTDKDIGIINQTSKDYTKPYIFASIQTLSRDKNLERLDKEIEYMIIDEYHHVAADTYVKILDYFRPKFLVGLTATPYRLDGKDIMKFVDSNIAIDIDVFEGIRQDILAPFKYVGLHDDIDYSQIRWYGIRYNVGDLDRKLIIHKRDQAVLKRYKELIGPENRLALGFCNSVNHVKRATSLFIKNGIKAIGLTWKDAPDYRNQVISDFRKGVYDILFTRDIFNEGVDFPECEAILFLRPTISKAVFFQQLGRGLRKREGKQNVIILDFIGNYHRAFEKRKWFLQFAQNEMTGKNIKPEYRYDPSKPEVLFDSRVIDIMDIQERHYTTAPYSRFTENKQELIDNYYNVKAHWDKISNESEKKEVNKFYSFSGKNIPPKKLLLDTSISKYSEWAYFRVWGNFVNFLEEIGEVEIKDTTITRWDSEAMLIKKFKIMATRLQSKLNQKFFNASDWFDEYGTNGFTHMTKLYGGFIGFKKEFGYPVEYERTCPVCGKVTTTNKNRRKNSSQVCSRECSSKYFIRTPKYLAALKEKREKQAQEMIPCLYCGKLIHKHVMNEKNNTMVTFKFCSRLCKQRNYITNGKQRPLFTREERQKKLAAANVKRWAKYREDKKNNTNTSNVAG